jgi:hypothetical protein
LRNLFYVEGKKVVPLDIFNMLDPIALAHLIQGDGAKEHVGLILCTESFNLKDVVRLINVLIIRYELDCTLRIINKDKKQYRIYIKKTSLPKLIKIVKPYIHTSMLYKLALK